MKLIYGVGINDLTEPVRYSKGVNTKEYSLWLQMLRRCYSEATLKKKTCYYSGVTLTLTGETALSLDRIDDSIGYTRENTVSCASVVNKVKNELLEKNLCKGLTNAQIKRMLTSFINIV